jgi:hypothetical protein
MSVAELRDGLVEILDAVDEDRLVALEMAREQEGRRIRGQPDHRHACAEGLDGEHDLRAQPAGEVRHIGCYVPARQVDEVKPIEHPESLRAVSWRATAGREEQAAVGGARRAPAYSCQRCDSKESERATSSRSIGPVGASTRWSAGTRRAGCR